jgi:cytochrome c biogenesis protein ResB
MRTLIFSLALFVSLSVCLAGQSQQPDLKAFEEETMRHYQALLRLETMDPPGNEKPVADYLKQVLEKERIEACLLSPSGVLLSASTTRLELISPGWQNFPNRRKRTGTATY